MLKIDVRRSDISNIQIITLSGEFDLFEKGRVDEYLSKALSENPRGIVIDLSSVSLMDSSGVGLLVAYRIKSQETGMRMALAVNNNNYLIRKFKNLGIFNESGIEVFGTVEDAEKELAKS